MEVTPATWEKAIEQPADNAFFSVHKPEFSVDFLWKGCGEAEWHGPGRNPPGGLTLEQMSSPWPLWGWDVSMTSVDIVTSMGAVLPVG